MAITEVVCQECGKVFYKAIMASHLSRKHSMSTDEYRKKYPGVPP